ncbi:hypothetical protein CC85DRAFT_281721 [Cutaneotrichosporon oleaginosum]|uniref:Uncharacterized protein n=1 Tax=Cutaneotrichosporon oleaginosum TaxID=879819 RepID=A0A0J0XYH0_9TREE|nr:uncharacterized protein CC85DRAFT_281721 [Cutaneotrichosporon oleaginosum]KLT46086.1 hypothetical protein CC85DRAFT_281721 [Cutaneotrichosporon oleaginosum]TXT10099.1 hypothetical protein COLE_04033 [Cutaneotrichosporon oleaginosum]
MPRLVGHPAGCWLLAAGCWLLAAADHVDHRACRACPVPSPVSSIPISLSLSGAR